MELGKNKNPWAVTIGDAMVLLHELRKINNEQSAAVKEIITSVSQMLNTGKFDESTVTSVISTLGSIVAENDLTETEESLVMDAIHKLDRTKTIVKEQGGF
jgi:hypothetical protein